MNQELKTALLTVVLSCIICLPRTGLAQDAKIAVVDIQALTLASDEGKTVNDKIEKRFQALSTEMDKAKKDIEDKETRLRTQDRLMSAAAKAQLSKEIDADKITFDRKNEDYQKQISDMQKELLGPVSGRAQSALAAYVNEEGLTLLIDLSAEKANIVWANPANDITQLMLKRLNDDFKKNGGSATTPEPAKPAAAAPASKPPAATTPSRPATTPATPATPRN